MHQIILHFQEESFRENIKLIMTIDDKIRDEKLQYETNREVAKISVKVINMNIIFWKN